MGDPSGPDWPIDAAYVHRQHAALRDLLELSAECAQRDAEIQRVFQTRLAGISARHERLERFANARFARLREKMAARQRAESKQVSLEIERAGRQVSAAAAQRLEALEKRAAAERSQLEQKLNDAIWLADSVSEGTEAELQHERGELRDELARQREALDATEQEANRELLRYRQYYTLADLPADESAEGAPSYREAFDQVGRDLTRLQWLSAPKWFYGWRLCLAVLLPPVVSVALVYLIAAAAEAAVMQIAVACGIALVGSLVAVFLLGTVTSWVAKKQVRRAAEPLSVALGRARRALDAHEARARKSTGEMLERARQKRLADIETAEQTSEPALAEQRRVRQEELDAATRWGEDETREQRQRAQQQLERLQQGHDSQRERLGRRYDGYLAAAAERRGRLTDENQARCDADRTALRDRWAEGLGRIQDLVRESERLNERLDLPWAEACRADRPEPVADGQLVRFGQLSVDVNRIATKAQRSGQYKLDVPPTFRMPALLAFPPRGSLLIRTQRDGRERAVAALRAVMLRLLVSLPAGRVRFTLLDPVGLGQSFAAFMHLADYDENLVGMRIWSEVEHIEQRLIDLTHHMENVIQKYLRNEFDTIVRYNEQAGELAEPYRFVVIADFPSNFTDEAVGRLLSIIHSGPRCGVYTLIVQNTWQDLPYGIDEVDLRGKTVVLNQDGGDLVWDDDVYGRFPLTIEDAPPASVQTDVLKHVGERARQAGNVELPFAAITPGEDRLWSGKTTRDVTVPMGRCGATRLQELVLGRGVAQHVLIAGKTGSGKSNLLHVLITNLALWYPPSEIEFYLIDFKKGVEFKTYATHRLPHARAIAIESDREFGVSVLEKLDAEMTRRGELYRAAGVQDLPAYREARPDQTMPRTLLLIDEFQELFTDDDRLAQQAALMLDRLVRQGRAFGIHVLLGSQTLGGTSGLPRGTMGQMAVRVALQCSEADSQLILNDDNTAAKLLSRPGEAIYNDAGGLIEGNSPFQISWLVDSRRDEYLDRVEQLAAAGGDRPARPIVFEGNAPADIADNPVLADRIAAWPPTDRPTAPVAWVGEPITIKAPTAARFRRQSGANMVIIGQQDDSALAVMAAAMLGLAVQYPADAIRLHLLDSSPPDSPTEDRFEALAKALPHPLHRVRGREAAEVVDQIAAEVQRRLDAGLTDAPPIFLFVHGLQRFRMLRKSEEEFGFSYSEESPDPAPARPDRQLADILREGPSFGVHTIAWCDTLTSLERTLDRQSIRELDHRLLFQMSATDSSNLIDSPEANRLGFYRALLYSEELGYQEKFRPYAFPQPAWLAEFAARTTDQPDG